MVLKEIGQFNVDLIENGYDACLDGKWVKGMCLSFAGGALEGIELMSLATGLAFYGLCTYYTVKAKLKI